MTCVASFSGGIALPPQLFKKGWINPYLLDLTRLQNNRRRLNERGKKRLYTGSKNRLVVRLVIPKGNRTVRCAEKEIAARILADN